MATDYAGKEKEFIASLAADTGKDLDAWMRAISGAQLDHRNDIIDWLRENGFTFANASWLERIHHNGGRLIYAEDQRTERAEPRLGTAAPLRAGLPIIPNVTVAAPKALPKVSSAPAPANDDVRAAAGQPPHLAIISAPKATFDAPVDALLLAAKGLRPLAMLTLQEIMKTIPGAKVSADGAFIAFADQKSFLALSPGAKALRLYGDFERQPGGRAARAESGPKATDAAAAPYPSVIVLTDARLVDDTFADLVRQAHDRAHR